MHAKSVSLLLVWLPLISAAAKANDTPTILVAVVDHVVDGDSLVIRHDDAKVSVRLEGIDAPEILQVFGAASKAVLAKKLPRNTKIVVEAVSKDKYGRLLARVYSPDTPARSISRWLVEQGSAWHFAKYNRDKQLSAAQQEARQEERGLWAFSRPNPPWLFRIQVDRGEVMPDDGNPVHPPSDSFESMRQESKLTHWLNLDSGQRHQIACARANYDRGKPCTSMDGKPCPRCQTKPGTSNATKRTLPKELNDV